MQTGSQKRRHGARSNAGSQCHFNLRTQTGTSASSPGCKCIVLLAIYQISLRGNGEDNSFLEKGVLIFDQILHYLLSYQQKNIF